MIKVDLIKKTYNTPIEYSFKDDYIPFSIVLEKNIVLPETIYTKNLNGENFIEFRFNKENRKLYEVTLVALQHDTIIESQFLKSNQIEGSDFVCLLQDNASIKKEYSIPITIHRSKNSICLLWNTDKNNLIRYYLLSEKFAVGVDTENNLVSVALLKLDESEVHSILL